jgi:hypothetical protein
MLRLLAKRADQGMNNGTHISADLINRRLGSGGKSNFYEPDMVEVAEAPAEDSSLSAGFIVKMLVLFVAVGGGTYFFEGSDLSWYDVKLVIGDLSRFQL